MNKLQIFNNDKYSIRITVGENEEPLFIASDVCKELDISNPTDAIRRLDDDESTLVSIEGASNGHYEHQYNHACGC